MDTYFRFLDKTEPFTDSELHALGIDRNWKVIQMRHEEVEETISQFEACAMEVIMEWYKETIHE